MKKEPGVAPVIGAVAFIAVGVYLIMNDWPILGLLLVLCSMLL